VQRIIKKNKKLRDENKSLRNLIQALPEFRQPTSICQCTQAKSTEPIDSSTTRHIKIKTEPGQTQSGVSDDDVIILDSPTKNPVENIVYDIEEAVDTSDDELDEDEFKCETCSTVQCKNNCELCDVEDVCEECHGQGGDYGPGEIWVCHECLPTCLECEAPLYTADDKCCGKGRSDDEVASLIKEESTEEEEEEEEETAEEEEEEGLEQLIKEDESRLYLFKRLEEEEKEEEVEESGEEEEEEESGEEEEEEVEVEESGEEEEEEVEESGEEEEEEVEVEESGEEEEEEVEVEESGEEEEEEVEVEESGEEEEEEVEESGEEEEEEEEVEESTEEEAEVFEITIKGTAYYTTNEVNGVIYAVDADDEVGDEIGKFVDKKPVFNK
jgi:DNA segregation ATPase FtsK/SpoIIIE-like protein